MDNSVLTFREYNIAGNVLRAYYDADDKLVFVLDSTLDDRKPNTLLIINPVGDRKWDDILANDYGVDLESVRPKKNNKYQKLDIEYSGLAEYDNLINAYENGDDLSGALMALAAFREDSVRRAAAERLAVAENSADKARETIVKTKETISDLQAKLRQLRGKLSQQKKQVGREPTKQSASKILRTDAQIDATNEKLQRAKKRLANAQKRLIVADTDAEMAREILSRRYDANEIMARPTDAVVQSKQNANAPVVTTTYNVSYDDDDMADDAGENDEIHFSTEFDAPMTRNVAAVANADNDASVARMPAFNDEIENTYITTDEPRAETMAENNDEVKPLFDKNPDILDEDIAFKPIDFGVSSPASDDAGEQNNAEQNQNIYENVIDDKPLSFTPPVDDKVAEQNTPINVRPITNEDENKTGAAGPVLDTITAVDMPTQSSDAPVQFDSELMSDVSPVTPDAESAPVQSQNTMAQKKEIGEHSGAASVAPVSNAAADNSGARPVPPAATLANAVAARPVSPITGNAAPTNPAPRKPTWIYYVLLILLIGLSVFTLWLYQKNTSKNVPDLTATVPTVETTADTDGVNDADSPFIPELETPVETTETQITVSAPVVQPEPVQVDVAEPEPEPESVPTPEPEPVTEPEPVAEPEPVVADVEIKSVNLPASEPVADETETVIETEEEILASKPAYNVSQNENMFVAAPEYDTETLRNDNLQAVDTTGPSVIMPVENQSGLNAAPVADDGYVPQSVTSQVWDVPADDLPKCPDGTAPDVNGCCTGEIYTDMGDAGFNCCPAAGGDCFPPII